jgi:hypothetical protein
LILNLVAIFYVINASVRGRRKVRALAPPKATLYAANSAPRFIVGVFARVNAKPQGILTTTSRMQGTIPQQNGFSKDEERHRWSKPFWWYFALSI